MLYNVCDLLKYPCDKEEYLFAQLWLIGRFYASDVCEEKTLEELTSVDFQTTVLGWSTDDWIFTEGQHPTLKRGN